MNFHMVLIPTQVWGKKEKTSWLRVPLQTDKRITTIGRANPEINDLIGCHIQIRSPTFSLKKGHFKNIKQQFYYCQDDKKQFLFIKMDQNSQIYLKK